MRQALLIVVVVAAAGLVAVTAAKGSPRPGATARCIASSYSYSQNHSGTCSHHGGVAVWLDGSSTSSGASATGANARSSGACGVERWTVKTLQDRPSLLSPVATTIRFLVTGPAPISLPTSRLPFERHIYTVLAAVMLVRQEADSDLHLVLRDSADHLIAEAPAPSCDLKATPLRLTQMPAARAAVRLCAKARITGVAFFDVKHGQTGVAPNAIELHPILAFHCLTG